MPHETSSRTDVREDGYVRAWYTVDGEEFWLGFFKDQDAADFEIANVIESATNR